MLEVDEVEYYDDGERVLARLESWGLVRVGKTAEEAALELQKAIRCFLWRCEHEELLSCLEEDERIQS